MKRLSGEKTPMKNTGMDGIEYDLDSEVATMPNFERMSTRDFPLASFYSCRNAGGGYAAGVEPASDSAEVVPRTSYAEAQTYPEAIERGTASGPNAPMGLFVQVISAHPLGAVNIESALSMQSALGVCLLPHAATEADALNHANAPRLFVLDGCSLTVPLGPLSSRLRANAPGSKFLALLAPDHNRKTELVHLFHWGIDGILVIDEHWKSQLPSAALALLSNRLWVPAEVLLAFVHQMKALLDRQLLPGRLLTGRESQVLQLLFRRLSNKEIAFDLKISERTAKFHVCNLLNKLGLESRKSLLNAFAVGNLSEPTADLTPVR